MLEQTASLLGGEVPLCDGFHGHSLLLPLHIDAHGATSRHGVEENVPGVRDVELDAALGVHATQGRLAVLSLLETDGCRVAGERVT